MFDPAKVPLGVLKVGHIQFQPALQPAKQLAIDQVGFGLEDKVR